MNIIKISFIIALPCAAIATRNPNNFDVQCRAQSEPAPFQPKLHACYLVNKNEVEFDTMYNNKQFHNHLDYYLMALAMEGANSSRLDAAYADQATQLDPAVPSQSRITDDTYNNSLGQYYVDPDDSWYLDFVEFFRNESKRYNGSSDKLFSAFLPRLIPSVGCMLLHPFIQLGYAYELNGGDSRLVVEGLAWLSTGYYPDPVPLNETAFFTSPYDSLKALHESGILSNSTVPYDDVPVMYGAIIPRYDLFLPADDSGEFDDALHLVVSGISEVVLRLFAATGYQGFYELHLVTGCRALRKISKSLDDPALRRPMVLYFWRAVMYTYAAIGNPAFPSTMPTVDNRDTLPDWEELLREGMPVTDTHFHKLLWLCKDEALLLDQERDTKSDQLSLLYHITGVRIVANFTAGNDWVH